MERLRDTSEHLHYTALHYNYTRQFTNSVRVLSVAAYTDRRFVRFHFVQVCP